MTDRAKRAKKAYEAERQELAKIIYEAWTLRTWHEPKVHTALEVATAVQEWNDRCRMA